MGTETRASIELTEYESRLLSEDQLSTENADILWRHYGKHIAVEFPSPKTDHQWQLTSRGYVGYIPLNRELGLTLRPRIELGNLFRMLEYAYRLRIVFLDDLFELDSLIDFYERLASILSKRTLDRTRKGLYRSYLPRSERLPYVRGSFDLARRLSRPWNVRLECSYHEHTPDLEENQILAWTLLKVARSGACTERVLPSVRQAYRSLHAKVAIRPFSAQACIDRLYNRLNDDYEPLHALCRFFLEHTGPSLESGEHRMLPFLISMPHLFELFVAEWLRMHLPKEFGIRAQERVRISESAELTFQIDLVLYEVSSGRAICVLDTKYKVHDSPAESDVEQIVAYAVSKGCSSGILIYPRSLGHPLDETVGSIGVRTLGFPLDGELEDRGRVFLDQLLAVLPQLEGA